MIDEHTKVLLVDDFDLVRNMLKRCLFNLGIKNTDEARDGNEAMQKLCDAQMRGEPFGAVFLDWNMPNKTGIEVLRDCRAQEVFKSLVIVMVTAEGEKKHVLKALLTGANDYVVKPFSPETLKIKIDHINQQLQKNAG